jgi:hypothetical protein
MKVKRAAESLSQKNVMPSTFTYSLTLLLSFFFFSFPLSFSWVTCLHVGFEVLVAVLMKSTVFWDIWVATCFHTGFLLGLFLYPEDEGDMLLRNVG